MCWGPTFQRRDFNTAVTPATYSAAMTSKLLHPPLYLDWYSLLLLSKPVIRGCRFSQFSTKPGIFQLTSKLVAVSSIELTRGLDAAVSSVGATTGPLTGPLHRSIANDTFVPHRITSHHITFHTFIPCNTGFDKQTPGKRVQAIVHFLIYPSPP